jgi:DNA-binding NarL/FixJ family response regulator
MQSRMQGASELLTSRELQIAVLKAQGFANRAIGRRLGISLFTVGAHLARTYSKLGVSSRSALAARIVGTVALHRRSADALLGSTPRTQ